MVETVELLFLCYDVDDVLMSACNKNKQSSAESMATAGVIRLSPPSFALAGVSLLTCGLSLTTVLVS
jgi:hypothetical protein